MFMFTGTTFAEELSDMTKNLIGTAEKVQLSVEDLEHGSGSNTDAQKSINELKDALNELEQKIGVAPDPTPERHRYRRPGHRPYPGYRPFPGHRPFPGFRPFPGHRPFPGYRPFPIYPPYPGPGYRPYPIYPPYPVYPPYPIFPPYPGYQPLSKK
ncbi:MAG: hypothetical protein A2577_13400 [Bdellovibrionales bacterium RIFOXYD1_FULL_36_51]|nr:MAG: hypothetical protein A2577_13400 [Bdellovibrionales bacterium RIFOXYD1_FULL_36_51]